MTDYNFAKSIADAIVEIHNEKFEALKKQDMESYESLFESEERLEKALNRVGYERVFVFDETTPRVQIGARVALKVESVNIYAIEEDDYYKCTVGYLQELCDRG